MRVPPDRWSVRRTTQGRLLLNLGLPNLVYVQLVGPQQQAVDPRKSHF